MNIENEIFKRCVIDFEKLIDYGFQSIDGKYRISKNILDDSFCIDIEILEDGSVNGKIYDLSFEEEYTNFRIENQTGSFASSIREEFEKVLNDIKNNCTTTSYFIGNQSNRITKLIFEKYHDNPEFLWEKFSGYGVFRNQTNEKWYAAIMNINKSKIDEGNEEVEIIDVKLESDRISKLLKRKGFYKAYHMNKENWITIILDDTISDEEVMEYIEESHRFTEIKDEWIIPANPKYYDVINCFNDTDTILWKQSGNQKVGDIVYLYVASPYSAILYKCEVLEVNIPYQYEDQNLSMSKVMKIKLLHQFDRGQIPFELLKEYGVNAIRGPRSVPKKLSEVIKSLEG